MLALLGSRKGQMQLALAGAAVISGLATAAAQHVPPAIRTAEIGVVMSAYVEGVVELRQLYLACAEDPADWDQGAAVLTASLEAAGLDETSARDLRARLAASGSGGVSYDCTGDVVTSRLSIPRPSGWPAFHSGMLERVGIKPVVPSTPDDPRLTALRAVFAEYIPQQKAALNCSALVQVEWFPQSYADWEDVVNKAEALVVAAGLDAEAVQALIGPARGAQLMQPAADRQVAIAACIDDTAWMNWQAMLRWYSLPKDVEKALGGAQ